MSTIFKLLQVTSVKTHAKIDAFCDVIHSLLEFNSCEYVSVDGVHNNVSESESTSWQQTERMAITFICRNIQIRTAYFWLHIKIKSIHNSAKIIEEMFHSEVNIHLGSSTAIFRSFTIVLSTLKVKGWSKVNKDNLFSWCFSLFDFRKCFFQYIFASIHMKLFNFQIPTTFSKVFSMFKNRKIYRKNVSIEWPCGKWFKVLKSKKVWSNSKWLQRCQMIKKWNEKSISIKKRWSAKRCKTDIL